MSLPTSPPPTGPGLPTPPISLGDAPASATARLATARVELSDEVLDRLRRACSDVTVDAAPVAEASRDWWPLGMQWATEGQVAGLAAAVVRPVDAAQVADVLAVCHEARVPVTAAGGRSGVCGASVPVHGGVVLDTTQLAGIVEVDAGSLVLDVRSGTFGDVLERELRSTHDVTLGHWPQSITLSTVGGWLACRSAGQLSGRYGKIEDIVLGLDVVTADGRQITTGGWPRGAVGPDLTQLFVGSEGTLGVITGARLRVHPQPRHERRSAWTLDSFADGLDLMRRIIQRGATPAVLRLYDPAEADRGYETDGRALLLVLDEGDPTLVDATMTVVATEAGGGDRPAEAADDDLVERWLSHRNEVSALEALISKGYTVDTMEVSGAWRDLDAIYTATLEALTSVEGTIAASAHQSHSYTTGGCLYFTFAGKVEPSERDAYYRALWDAGQGAVLANGGNLSHHHGIGLNRARFVRGAMGEAFGVLAATKAALDPHGILNPGKLGLPSPWSDDPAW